LGLQDRLKEARKKKTDLGSMVSDYKGDAKDLGKYMKKQIKKAPISTGRRGKGEIIGTWPSKRGEDREIKAPTPGQEKKMERRGEKWQSTGYKRLTIQAKLIGAAGLFIATLGVLGIIAGLVFSVTDLMGASIMGSASFMYGLYILIPGLIVTAIGAAAVSAAMARIKFMILTPERKKDLSEKDIIVIVERFLSGA